MKKEQVRMTAIQAVKLIVTAIFIFLFVSVGYFLMFTKIDIKAPQASLLESWAFWLYLFTFLCVVSLFGSAIPIIERLISLVISARFGTIIKNKEEEKP